jgi:ferrous iron transport protein A
MTLTDLPFGASAIVSAITESNQTTKRLMEMGVVPGASVRVIKSAPFGDPLEIIVRGYHLALRKSEADHIEVVSLESQVSSQK